VGGPGETDGLLGRPFVGRSPPWSGPHHARAAERRLADQCSRKDSHSVTARAGPFPRDRADHRVLERVAKLQCNSVSVGDRAACKESLDGKALDPPAPARRTSVVTWQASGGSGAA